MRINNWYISNLDASQKQAIAADIDTNIIVQGSAGSGKTNLAIHRALQAKDKGSYLLIVLTIGLKRMIAYGLNTLGLDPERVAYAWAWENRGIDLIGDVYAKVDHDAPTRWRHYYDENGQMRREKELTAQRDVLYLVNDGKVRKFIIDQNLEDGVDRYSLDFSDWVDDRFYRVFGRRSKSFIEVEASDSCFDPKDEGNYMLVPAGVIFKCEHKADYLIVDEAQDFNVNQYKNYFLPNANRAISLFGDSNQKMNPNGSTIQEIHESFMFSLHTLKHNYRLPKTIAKIAQKICPSSIDLVATSLKEGGNTDYPHYPKPQLLKFKTIEDEMDWIVNKIRTEDLDDVAILAPDEDDVEYVHKYFEEKGMPTQVLYRTGSRPPYQTVNTIDFTNNEVPSILTYYAAKGSEFEHVFIPGISSNFDRICKGSQPVSSRALFVACTRSTRNLYMTYHGTLTNLMNDVSEEDLDIIDMTSK